MADAVVLGLLRSPLGRLFGGLCELEFTGRRSGRAVRLPVQCAQDGDPGRRAHRPRGGKQWCRNFTDPHPVRFRIARASLACTGRLVLSGDADHAENERVTAGATRRQRYGRMILIDPALDLGAGEDDSRPGSQSGDGGRR